MWLQLGATPAADEAAGGALGRNRVALKAPLRAQEFSLRDVRLLEGPFRHAQELDRQYLLALEPDRLLHNFRVNAGLPSAAKPLGGWEEPKCEVRGHFVGHFLSACALMHASTGDERLKQRADLIVAELAKCQEAVGNGYLSAYPESFIERVERVERVWAPWYTLHKLFAGLEDMYVYGGNEQALRVACRFADWVGARSDKLSEEQMQRMLGNEHGGMNETLANLFALTGEARYLRLAQRFNHQAVLGPAAHREDKLTGLHANTQIPKFIGAARQYELTGDESLKTAALFFWDTVVKERSYVIGGHSDGEMFTPKERLSEALGPSTTETCNTYNMLKLTRHLFGWEPRAEYADYYERALYNHILASQNPADGMTCYYVPLRSGARKEYSTPNDSFWCCTGTGIENHATYGDSIYFHDAEQALYVNLFIASELEWRALGLKLRQETRFPLEGRTRLRFECAHPLELGLRVRQPAWATAGFAVRVNGRRQKLRSAPGSFVTLARRWQSGDTVEVTLPLRRHVEGFRDNPRRFAVLDGPLVLSAEVDLRQPLPAVVGEPGQLLASLKPVAGRASTFAGSAGLFRGLGGTTAVRVTLEPFYAMHGARPYVVYWDAHTPAQWQAKEQEFRVEAARRQELAARTVDAVQPGDEPDERNHALQGAETAAGDFGGHKWRHATDGGWFAWNLKVLPGQPQELRVTYWGSDAGEREFDILVDGTKVATQRLQNNRPNSFFDEVYPLPAELTQGKERVTIRFQAHPRLWAGGVFGVRVLKR